ncbi:MAG: enoyl-CoA hydratase/isomerase family protein [Elusimicrobia bacterium]|nr:enoyl-CoA hydratase/isomerase family protein [Elusimicrobiota bacterium]
MTTAAAPEVLVETEGPIGLVALNRPQVLNALSLPVMKAVAEALAGFERDAKIRAVVLSGSSRAFSAGADIGEFQALKDSGAAAQALDEHLARWDFIGSMAKPVIAAVSGFALGGGCELAMACDLIVASETAVFGQPEVAIGVIPGAGGTQRLTKAVGKALAMEMCLAGRRLSAREALAHGLVNRVVAPESLPSEAKALARRLAGMPPLAVAAAKEAVRRALDLPLAQGLAFERKAFYALFDTADQKEGIASFLEKRKPAFSGS